MTTFRESLREWAEQVALVDHHVHGAWRSAPARAAYADALNEADTDPAPPDRNPFDSQIGFAVRAWCAPILELEKHADPDAYLTRREELGEEEVTRRFLRAAGVSDWLVDTGLRAETLLTPAEMAAASGARGHEIVRLEALAEQIASADTAPDAYAEVFRTMLADCTRDAVGAKTILAYRAGFDVDLGRPDDAAVRSAYSRWRAESGGDSPRLADPTLIAFGVHEAVAAGLPVQFHVGLGDRDMDLHRSNPLLLSDFLRLPEVRDATVLLLHCYPFEREAGYLAQGYRSVYLDVGLSLNYLGARARALVARSFELAPFSKILFSSDAFGPADLHYLGAHLWRRCTAAVLGDFVEDGDWSLKDARRVLELTAHTNAYCAYPLLPQENQP